MRYFYRGAALLALMTTLTLSVRAEGDMPKPEKPAAEKPEKPAMPPAEELSLTGKLVKKETTRKDKAGEDKTTVMYHLVTADGEIMLPPVGRVKAGETAVDYAANVDKDVVVQAQGYTTTKTDKAGKEKKTIRLKKVVSIIPAPAPAPAE